MLGFRRVVWGERIDWDCFRLVQVSVALMSGEGLYSQWNKQTNKQTNTKCFCYQKEMFIHKQVSQCFLYSQ